MTVLRNLRTGAVLAGDVAQARSFWQKFWGLMGQPGLPTGRGLYITDCQSIHSLFMRFPFDAVFIDKQRTVVHLIHAMPAWRASRMVWKAEGVIELPAGVLRSSDTRLGDVLALE